MTQAIDRAGAYRGVVVGKHAVNTTKNGFPQFVGTFAAAELWDDETQEWQPWGEFQMEITAYLCLFNADGPLLNAEQAMKAFGWDGGSLAELNDMDLAKRQFLFRVEEDTYQGKTQLKVNWVDDFDASPTLGIRKISSDELKDLDAKFGLGKKVKPASAPKAPPKAKKSKAKVKPKAEAPVEKSASEAEAPTEKSESLKAPPKPTPPTPPVAEPDSGLTGMTKDEAWASITELRRDDVEDDQVMSAWCEACCKIAKVEVPVAENGDRDLTTAYAGVVEADFTPEMWLAVRDATLDEVPHMPF